MTTPIQHPLGTMSVEEFLRDYWQKKPLLIKNSPLRPHELISAEELAGVACENEVESRIIRSTDWTLKDGPFEEVDFSELGSSDWTLLIQNADRFVPPLQEIVEPFAFIPTWRFDDLMVSFAAPGGGVGPHIDQYDVFLIQGEGRRLWEIESTPRENEEILPDMSVRILKEFHPDQRWTLQTGDILYLPPKFAHSGTALSPCTTFSVGFRAPSWKAIAEVFDTETKQEGLYTDPPLKPQKNPSEILPATLERVRSEIPSDLSLDESASAFGRLVTLPRSDSVALETPFDAQEFETVFQENALRKMEGARMACFGDRLFIDGHEFLTVGADRITRSNLLFYTDLKDQLSILRKLTNLGFFYFQE